MKTTPDTEDTFLPTQWSLVRRLKDLDDQMSWREFFDTYWRIVHRAATRAGLADQEAQDVLQETFVSVAKEMPAGQVAKSLKINVAMVYLIRHRVGKLLKQEIEALRAKFK